MRATIMLWNMSVGNSQIVGRLIGSRLCRCVHIHFKKELWNTKWCLYFNNPLRSIVLWFGAFCVRCMHIWCMIVILLHIVRCSIYNATSLTDKCQLRPFTQCSDRILLPDTEMLALVIYSPLAQKTSIKGCLLVFTLFIYGLSPLRSRLFFRPSSYNQGI